MSDRARRPSLAGLSLLSVLMIASPAEAQTSRSADADRPVLGTTFDADLLRDLPTSDNVFALIEAVEPSIVSDRFSGGGLYTGTPARLGGFLGSWTQTLFRVGDVGLTDPNGSGTPLLFPDLMLWERIDVTTGMMPADVDTPGVAVSLEPRRPTPTWTRTIQIGSSHGSLASPGGSTAAPPIARLDTWDRAAFVVSGPVIANRLGAVLAASWTRGSQFVRAGTDPFQHSVATTFGHLVFTPRDQHEIRLVGWAGRTKTPLESGGPFTRPETSATDLTGHLQAAWEYRTSDEVRWRVFAGYTERDRTVNLGGSTTGIFERLVDGPASEFVSLGSATVSQWSIGTRLMPPVRFAGRPHTLHLGVDASGARTESASYFSGTVGELVNGSPARIWSVSSPGLDSVRRQIGIAAYVSDHIELTSRVAADVGMRVESVSGSAAGAENGVSWRTWLPRAAIRWSLIDAWRTAVFAAYGRSGYRLPLDLLAIGDPAAPTADVFRWNPLSAGSLSPGPFVARTGPGTHGDPGFSGIDADLRRPLADEVVVGLDVSPSRNLRVRIAGTVRRENHLLGLTNVGVPAAAYSTFTVQDPGGNVLDPGDDHVVTVYNRLPSSFGQDRYLLTNPEQEAATFKGIEVSALLRKERVALLAGATASIALAQAASPGFGALENDQSNIGELFVDPNAATFARGRPFNDRAYTLKLAGVYRFAGDIRLGAIARYQDGQPFARMLVFPDLGQGATAVRAFANGDSRFSFTATLDLRLQKGLTIGPYRLDAILDVYNLLNSAYGVEEQVAAAPDVRTVTAVQPPRVIHLGMRFGF